MPLQCSFRCHRIMSSPRSHVPTLPLNFTRKETRSGTDLEEVNLQPSNSVTFSQGGNPTLENGVDGSCMKERWAVCKYVVRKDGKVCEFGDEDKMRPRSGVLGGNQITVGIRRPFCLRAALVYESEEREREK